MNSNSSEKTQSTNETMLDRWNYNSNNNFVGIFQSLFKSQKKPTEHRGRQHI